MSRLMRGLTRRAEQGDLEALRHLVELGAEIEREQQRAAQLLNTEHSYSWSEIGLGVGLTKQTVYKRWGGAS